MLCKALGNDIRMYRMMFFKRKTQQESEVIFFGIFGSLKMRCRDRYTSFNLYLS